jgi:hypothetical protein
MEQILTLGLCLNRPTKVYMHFIPTIIKQYPRVPGPILRIRLPDSVAHLIQDPKNLTQPKNITQTPTHNNGQDRTLTLQLHSNWYKSRRTVQYCGNGTAILTSLDQSSISSCHACITAADCFSKLYLSTDAYPWLIRACQAASRSGLHASSTQRTMLKRSPHLNKH